MPDSILDRESQQTNPDPFGGDASNWTRDELDARDAWMDECEAARLREIEEAERVGNSFTRMEG